jgi:FixJ family two-component response regulator
MESKKRKTNVVVVENDSAMLKAVGRLLASSGYDTELYSSAEQFLARDCKAKMDCLVLDIDLDGMTGLELQKQLVANGFTVPIIFITGHGDEPTIANAIDQGCVAYLHKPFDSDSIFSALEAGITTPIPSKHVLH